MKLLVEVDGVTTPLGRCHWVEFSACGCPRSTMWASAEYASEETVWAENYPRKRERERAMRHGRAELMTHERWEREVYPLLLAGWCKHETTATAGKETQ